MAEAIDGGFIQQFGQALAEPGEILFGRQRARTVGFTALHVGVDQIDIGTEVELATAQLAQPEHHQLLRLAVVIGDHPVALGELLLQGVQRQAQAVLGQRGSARQSLRHVIQPGQVAPDQAGGHRRAPASQLCRPVAGLQRVEHRRRQRGAARRGQLCQQAGLAHQGVQGEVAADGQLHQQRLQFCRDGIGHCLGQARQRAVDEGLQGGGQFGGGEGHALILAGSHLFANGEKL